MIPRTVMGAGAVLAIALTAGCATGGGGSVAPRSVLATRALQTHDYAGADPRQLLTAVAQGLQDAGFQLRNSDVALGIVTASLESTQTHKANPLVSALFWYPYLIPFRGRLTKRTVEVVEATATVIQAPQGARVRVVCHRRVLDADGHVKSSEEVSAGEFYQDLFARIDKALFLARENL